MSQRRSRASRRQENQTNLDNFAGYGPRNWTRSDEFIMDDVCRRLTNEPALDASGITVLASKGDVTLGGAVRSHQDRTMANRIVQGTHGVKAIHDTIHVVAQETAPMAAEKASESSASSPRR